VLLREDRGGVILIGRCPFQWGMKGTAMRVAMPKLVSTGSFLKIACLAVAALGMLFEPVCAQSQATSSPPSRPILFVHGICADAYDAEPLFNNIYTDLDPSLYPSPTVYVAQFNSVHNSILFWTLEGAGTALQYLSPIDETAIEPNARFFSIMLYDPISDSTDPENVAKISILNKAYEVSQVIKHIIAITHIQDVIVVGHSMGGLDTRAYIENLASQGACYDYQSNIPHYQPDTCKPGCNSTTCMPNASYGSAAYAGDIGDLITLDTPHLGTPLAVLSVEAANIPLGCFLGPKTNTYELEGVPTDPFGYLTDALNYSGQSIAGQVPTQNSVPIQAVQDDLTDVGNAVLWPLLPGESDDVVPLQSQAVPTNVQTNSNASVASQLANVSVLYQSSAIQNNQGCFEDGVQVLHLMSCLGTLPLTEAAIVNQISTHEAGTLTSINVNATHNGSPWTGTVNYQINGPDALWDPEITVPMTVSDIPLGTYSISHITGGPASAGPPTVTVSPSPTVQQGQWTTTTFTINFADKSASTTTISASSTQIDQGSSVTLTAKVQVASGTPTGAVTFYSNGNSLSTVPIDGTGTGAYTVSTLPVGSNAITASYTGDTNFSGSTSSAVTVTVNGASMTLPAPTLTSPPNGGSNQLTTPVFIWSQVPNNAGYRIMVATNPAALPTDPNASSCVPSDSACVIDQSASLSTNTYYYATPSGILQPSTTYYWQVHARANSPYSPGYWAAASFSTASGSVTNDFSLQVSPTAQTVTQGNAGSFTINTATTSGSGQTVALSISGLPAGVTPSFTPASITSGYQSTLTLSTSSSTPVGTYSLTVTGTGSSATHTYPISLTVAQSSTATYTVTVQLTGLGIVSSQDGRLNCKNTSCSAIYTQGSSIILSEVAGTNYSFAGWGEACTGLGACSFTVTNNMLVTATFNPIPGTVESALTTTVVGSGTISSTDGLVNCATSCVTTYPNNASVILNAIPNPGYALSGWTGDCTGQGQCVLPLDHNKTVQATFSSVAGNTLMVVSPGTITTIAGNGTQGYGGDGGPATLAEMNQPFGTAVDANGNVFIADFDGNRIRVINTQPTAITIAGVTIQSGDIATLAGDGTGGFSGDGGPAVSSEVYGPTGLTFDAAGNLYISDADNSRVRVINLQSTAVTIAGVTIQPSAIQTIAGNGHYGYTGDGVSATSAGLTNPMDVLVDMSGNIYIAEWERVRIVNSSTGVINTYAGGGPQNCTTVANGVSIGCLATNTLLSQIAALAMDSLGNLFLADGIGSIKMVYKGGAFPDLPTSPVAGYIYAINEYNTGCSAQSDPSGDGCPISDSPGIVADGLAVDAGGSLYFADFTDSRVHRVDRSTGILSAMGGNGTAGYLQDGVAATSTEISFNPSQYGSTLSTDPEGNLYFADASTSRIREISSSGALMSLLAPSLGVAGSGVTITVENAGAFTMNQPALSIAGIDQSEFSETNTCSSSIQPGASCTVTVVFTPAASGTRHAQLSISSSNTKNSPQTIQLSGNEVGAAGTLSLGSTSISFPAQLTGSASSAQAAVITNSGTADLVAPTFLIRGGNSSEFYSTNTCQDGIATGANCSVAVTFNPLASGTRTAILTITDTSASNSPQTISLSGVGMAPLQTPTVTVTPSLPSITSYQPLTVTAGVTGGTGSPTPTGSVTVTSGTYVSAAVALGAGSTTVSIPAGLLPAGADTLTVTYTPDSQSSSIYKGTSGVATVTVSAMTTPTVQVMPSSSNITTMQTLTVEVTVQGATGSQTPTGSVVLASGSYVSSASSLTGGGTTISVPAGSLAVGSDSLAVSYTPDSSSSSTYNGASGATTISVTAPAPTITFTVANQTYGNAPFTVSATSNSSGAFTYSVVSGPATVSGSTVTLTGAGTVTLQASQAASAGYTTGTQTATFTVTPATPTITFTVPNHTYGDAPFRVSATSNSNGAITYSLVSGPATISGSTVTLTGAGTVVLQASQAALGNYTSGTQTASFTVAGNAPTISFSVPNHTYGDAPFTVSATSNSSGAITYSVASGPATVSGSTVTLTGAGTVVLQANQAAADNYASGTQTATFTVGGQAPTMTFTVPSHTYGDAPFTVSAASNSSGAISYSVVSGPATISGSTVTLTGAGAVVLQASQIAAGSYTAGTQTATFTVAGNAPTITFAVPNHTYGDTPFAVSATSNSSGAIAYSVVSGPATISGSTVTLTGAGTVVLQASQIASGGYTSETQTATFTVVGNAPTIAFTVPNHTYGDAPFTVLATSNSGGAITYSVVSGPATISGSNVTLTGAGAVVLQASQAAVGNYTAGTQTATFSVAGQVPTITFTVPNHIYGDAAFTVSATSNSSGAVTYSVVSGPATISGATVTLTGVGTVVLQASQVAVGGYVAGTQTASFTVATEPQTITFAAPASPVNYGVASISLSAISSSGLNVTFSVLSGPASVSGSTLTVTGAGTVVVAANQSGNANYAVAPQVTQSITVNKIAPSVGLTASPNPVLVQNTVTLTATVSSSVSTSTGSVIFSDGGTTLGTINLAGGIATLTTSTLAAGSHSITAAYGGDGNFTSGSSTAVSETVEDFTLTTGGSGSSQSVQPGGTATYTLPMTPSGGTTFPGAVTFAASGVPSGFTATFSPTSLPAGSSATNVALMIQVPLSAMLEKSRKPGRGLPLVALGILVLPFVAGIKRSGKGLRRLTLILLIVAGIGDLSTLTGCGGGGNSGGGGGSQPQTYNITVTATSGSLSHSTIVTLTVQ
jgi:sugar lactone lactonase YvrE